MHSSVRLSLVLLLGAVASSATAQDRCYTDKLRATTCTDPQGHTVRGRADPNTGVTNWRDDLGRTFSTPGGEVSGEGTDASGNSVWVGPRGTVTGHSDGEGHSIYTDERGRAVRCHDDNLGHHVCAQGRAP